MNKNTKELIFLKEIYLLNYNNTIKYFSDYNLTPRACYLQEEDEEYCFDFEVKNEKERSLGKFITDTFSKADFFKYIKSYLNYKRYSNILYLIKLDDDIKIDYPRWNIAQNKQQAEKSDIKVIIISFTDNGEPLEETLYFSLEEYSPETFMNNDIDNAPKEINHIQEISNHFQEELKFKPTYLVGENEIITFDFEIIKEDSNNTKVLISYFDKETTLFEIRDRIKKCFLLQEQGICNSFLTVTQTREMLKNVQQELFKSVKNRGNVKIVYDNDIKPTDTIIFSTVIIDDLQYNKLQTFCYKHKETETKI